MRAFEIADLLRSIDRVGHVYEEFLRVDLSDRPVGKPEKRGLPAGSSVSQSS